jgi:peptidyl-prolyl cis-trans isomerase B (cyclophilin B)
MATLKSKPTTTWLKAFVFSLLLGFGAFSLVQGQAFWPWQAQATPAKTTAAPAPANTEKNGGCYNTSAKRHGVVVRTSRGTITLELFCDLAPKTVTNFEQLVGTGFYSSGNMTFHRVVPGFVVQTGDPTNTGTGGSRKKIALEVHQQLAHTGKGILAMARSADPDSASSQFYITLNEQPSLDGKYAVFGRVLQGLDVLDKIHVGDELYGIDLKDVVDVQAEPNSPPLYDFRYRVGHTLRPTAPKKRP